MIRTKTVLLFPAIALTMITGALVPSTVEASPPARTRLLASGLASPIGTAAAPGDNQHIYVIERAGTVAVLDRETGAREPGSLVDITGQVSLDVDDGFLGLAFDPDYQNNGYFYINYNATDMHMMLVRYHCTPGAYVADPESATIIWRWPRPTGHNGGWIGFSPVNGLLYITVGDGDLGGTADFANRAQTIVNQPMGKIHRIDPHSDDYPADPDRNFHIPPSNPFVGITGDDEIWSYGLRNPWRASFDRLTGDFYFGDVGMDSWEELDAEPVSSLGGRNYGWPCTEGTHCMTSTACVCNPAMTLPYYDYSHTVGRAVTGGYVYRGATIPALQGVYFYSDFLAAKVWSLRPDVVNNSYSEFTDRSVELTPAGTTTPLRFIASMGEDTAGELYFSDLVAGRVYKMVPYPCQPVIDLSPTSQSRPLGSNITLSILAAGQDPLTFRWRRNGMDLTDNAHIQGAATATLTINNAQSTDAGIYDVLLNSPCGSAQSAGAVVNVQLCYSADINNSGTITVQDLFDFLAAYFSMQPAGDFNHSFNFTVQDIFDFLYAYFSGCM